MRDASEQAARARSGAGLGVDTLTRLALAAFVTIVLGRALFTSQVFYYRDITGYWYPLIESFVRTVAGGEWPLWNPSFGFGYPLLEDPNLQLAYPLTWLNLVMPPALYYKVFVLAHLLWGAFGAQRLARSLGLEPLAAFVAAALFSACGPWLSGASLFHHFAGLAWLPWLWWAVERVLAVPTLRSGALLGAIAAAQSLAGSADLCVMGGLGALVRLGASQALRLRTGQVLRACGVAVVAAALLGGVQWLPTLGILGVGVRGELGAASSAYWSLHPYRIVELLVPRVLVDLPLSSAARELLLESREAFLRSVYLGAPALLLALVGLLFRGPQRPLALAFAFFFIVALGRHTPLHGLMLALPPVALLRFPIKFLWPAALLLALLAGYGAHALSAAWSERDRRRGLVVASLGAMVGIVLVGASLLGVPELLLAPLLDPGEPEQRRQVALAAAAGSALVSGASLALLGVLLALRARSERSRAQLPLIAALLVVADVGFAGWSTYRLAPAALLLHRPPLVETLADEASVRVYSRKEPRERLVELLRRGAGAEASAMTWLLGDIERLRPPSSARWGLDGSYQGDFTGLAPAVAGQLDTLVVRGWGRPAGGRLLRLGSVSHVVALRDWGPELAVSAGFESVFSEPIRLMRVAAPLPRVYSVSGARVLDEPDSLAALLDPQFDPLAEVVLAPPAAAQPVRPGFESRTELLWRRSNSVGIRAELAAPGFVVLTDAHWPGWRATVDGAPAPVWRANAVFRAVRVEAGRHEIELRYAPPLVGWGLASAALGLLLVGVAWRRGRSLDAPPADS